MYSTTQYKSFKSNSGKSIFVYLFYSGHTDEKRMKREIVRSLFAYNTYNLVDIRIYISAIRPKI